MKTFLILALLAIAAIWFLGGQPATPTTPTSLTNVAQTAGNLPPNVQAFPVDQFTDAEFQQWLSFNALTPARAFYCNGAGQAGVYTWCKVLDGTQMYTVRRINGQLVRE